MFLFFKRLFFTKSKHIQNVFVMMNLLLLLFFFFFNYNIYLLKMYLFIFILSFFVLCLASMDFEDTKHMYHLHLVFLYLNLMLFGCFFYFFVCSFFSETNFLILYQKNSMSFFMLFLLFFSFMSFKSKSKNIIVKEEFVKINMYVHSSFLLLEKRLKLTNKLGIDLPFIYFFLSFLVHILKSNLKLHFVVTYLVIIVSILKYFLFCIWLLLFFWFFFVTFSFYFKMNSRFKEKYNSEKYVRLLKK